MTEASERVLFVDDDEAVREASLQRLQLAGINAQTFASAEEALRQLTSDFEGVVVTDIRMPGIDGHQFYDAIQKCDPEIPVIFISGHALVGEAVESLRRGVHDFLVKPYSADDLLRSIEQATKRRRQILEARRLRALADEAQSSWPMMGASSAMDQLRAQLRRVAEADVDALIEGEAGVGKELAARALHSWGRRQHHPFVVVNLSALPAALIESELFGHQVGAFAGALRPRVGLLEYAHRGTLFLDAIETIPPEIQVKLLRFLSEREVTPLGANEARPVDVRVIGALKTQGVQSAVSSDLQQRLDVARIEVPPLRDRPSDIPLLFAHFLTRAADRAHRAPPEVDHSTRIFVEEHNWPGNVRELSNYAEKVALGLHMPKVLGVEQDAKGLRDRLDAYEAELIKSSLTANCGNVLKVLEDLQLPRVTFYARARRLNIDPMAYRNPKGCRHAG